MPTALEIAMGRSVPLTQGILMAVQTSHPLLSAFDVRTTTDKRFMSLVLTGLPSSGFVEYNQGFTPSKTTLAIREFDCKLIGGQIAEEVITANEWNKAHPHAGYTYFDLQTEGKTTADLRHIERCTIYGTAVDPKAPAGLKELTPFIPASNNLSLTDSPDDYDFTKSVINAGGTAAGTASSVYSICFGDKDAQLVIGNDQGGEFFTMSDIIQQMLPPDPAKPTETSLHNVMQIHGFIGLSVGGFTKLTPDQTVPTQYAVRRLANVTNDAAAKVTDAKLEKLVLSHNDGKRPSILAMSPRSGDQWAASRSAANVSVFLGGMGSAKDSQVNLQAPRPTNYEGIPVVYTSLIRNNDTIEI
jgi:hypothetical protein